MTWIFEDGGNPVVMNRIWTAMDPVLVDAYVCQQLHYKVSDVPYVKLASELGVGCSDITKSRYSCTGRRHSAEHSRETKSGRSGRCGRRS